MNSSSASEPVRYNPARTFPWLTKAEYALAILLSAGVLFFLVVRATHAGALWRDECGTIQLAQMPRISQIIDSFDHQTFPPLFPLGVRGYTRLFGGSDTAYRWSGFALGVAFVCGAWLVMRGLGNTPPLLSLAFFGLSPTFLTWGTTVSGYGFGAVLIILFFAIAAKVLQYPRPGIIFAAFIAALLSQQFVIGNLTLSVTIALTALLLAVMRRSFKTATIFAVLALCCLLVGALYLKIFSTGDWRIVLHERCHFSDLWREFTRTYGPNDLTTWVTRIGFVTAAVAGLSVIGVGFWQNQEGQSPTLSFTLLVMLLSPTVYLVSLLLLGYQTHPWHYLLLLAVLAVSIDTVLSEARVHWLRIARVAFAVVAVTAVVGPAWQATMQRQSNMDVAAAKVTAIARPNDLIVVAPWPFGISFNRYYHGPTPWVTLPIIEDHQIHRYDLMMAKMISAGPLDDLFEKIHQTLASGNCVWFVGGLRPPSDGKEPLSVIPAPDSRYGWDCAAYMEAWTQQMAVFVLVHAQQAEMIEVGADKMVNGFESVPLAVANGWK